jgi:hypothetical protein
MASYISLFHSPHYAFLEPLTASAYLQYDKTKLLWSFRALHLSSYFASLHVSTLAFPPSTCLLFDFRD